MSSETYDLVFSGELVRGADPAQARRNIGNLFKISEAKVEALFSGKPVTLKKNLDFATANKYRVAIKKAGCRVDLVEKKSEVAQSQPEPSARPQGKAVFATSEPNPVSPDKEEVQQSPEEAEISQTNIATKSQIEAAQPQSNSESEAPPLPVVEEVEAAPPPAEFPEETTSFTSSLSLAPVQGNLVDSSELEHLEPVEVDIGDISIKSGDGDLLNDDEKTVFEPVEIDMDAELAPVGADLLAESEREQVEIVEIDLSEFTVADPGEDLGQEKEEKKALDPDISHLALE